MALFASCRDASLLRSINRELINRFIDVEVGFYKLSLEDTRTNMYDESDSKVYYKAVRVNCLVGKDEKAYTGDDAGYDASRTATFAFFRPDMVQLNIFIEEGDVLEWDNEFYEIDEVGASQYWAGKNPDTDFGSVLGLRDQFGQSVAIVATAHVTRRNRLNIQETRSGINRSSVIPRNL